MVSDCRCPWKQCTGQCRGASERWIGPYREFLERIEREHAAERTPRS